MKKFLICVTSENNNKFYNMELVDGQTVVEYGRIGEPPRKKKYPGSKFNSLYKSKLKKYQDITHLKTVSSTTQIKSGNKEFQNFVDNFSRYASKAVFQSYAVESCTKQQISEAQALLDKLSATKISKEKFNEILLQLFQVIPRKMRNVNDFLLKDSKDKNTIVVREQDSLDSFSSNLLTKDSDLFTTLDISFEEIELTKELHELLQLNKYRYKVHKVYKITNSKHEDRFNKELSKSIDNKSELLIHGTRNPNVFSILNTGLLIRPSNAAMISGAAYGDGIYHSAHTGKSMNYTGWDNDKIFFIQKVNTGKKLEYNGWYREGKSISRKEMERNKLLNMGYDSLFVKPGDGLLNSEYIVYNANQTVTNYVVWFKER